MEQPLHIADAPRFYLFLFVHAAYADFQMHSQEIRYILEKLKELFDESVDVYEEFLTLKDHYESLSDNEIDDLISANFPKHVGSETHQNVLSWLSGVIQADGVVKESELKFFAKVKAILENPISH